MALFSTAQLKQALLIRERIEALEHELDQIAAGETPTGFAAMAPKTRRKMSAPGRRRIAAAQKARWAKVKAAKATKPKRRMSAAAKAKLAAIARKRWAKAKASGKSRL